MTSKLNKFKVCYEGKLLKKVKGPHGCRWLFREDEVEKAIKAFHAAIFSEYPPDIFKYTLEKNGEILARCVPYKDPKNWQFYRVRFYGNKEFIKRVYKFKCSFCHMFS